MKDIAEEKEDKFPSYPPGGRATIPKRLIDAAKGDINHAFLLWWAEDTHKSMESIINDLARK